MKDLWKEDVMEFNSWEQRANSFEEVGWLKYHSIISAIPALWKDILKNGSDMEEEVDIAKILLQRKPTGTIYRICKDDETAIIKSAVKWQTLLGETFDMGTHRKAFTALYKITNVVKLRSFQYRLLHNKIFCNNVLYHWKVKDTKKCEYCDQDQNITHLLFYCNYIRRIWRELFEQLEMYNDIELNCCNIIYGMVHPKSNHIANFITLIGKQFIYRCKCENSKPTTKRILMEINLIYSVEKYNAQINDKLNVHNIKWSAIGMDRYSNNT